MLVPFNAVIDGVTAYARTEIVPKLPGEGIKGFGVGFVSALVIGRIEHILRQLMQHPVVAMLELVDDKDRVELDTLRIAALQAMPAEGISIQITPQIKMTFGEDDITRLYEFIKG